MEMTTTVQADALAFTTAPIHQHRITSPTEDEIQACMTHTGMQHVQARNSLIGRQMAIANGKFPFGKPVGYDDTYEQYLQRVPASQRTLPTF